MVRPTALAVLRLMTKSNLRRLLDGSPSWSFAERQRCTKLVVVHSREVVSRIYVFCPAKEELLERLHRPGPQWITDAAKRDLSEKRFRARHRDDREVVREDPHP